MLLLPLVVLAALAEPDRAKLLEMISAKPFGNHDALGHFHRSPHAPVTNQRLMSLVDDASLSAALIALRNHAKTKRSASSCARGTRRRERARVQGLRRG